MVLESFAENLIVNYGEVNRQSDYPTVKQESHPPPKKPLPMNPLASPVTEWGAPGAYTRSKDIRPPQRPQLGRRGRAYYPQGKTFLLNDHRGRS